MANVTLILLGTAVGVFGVGFLKNPEYMLRLTHLFMLRNADLSPTGDGLYRLYGALLLFVGLVMIISGLLS